jgi:hypothetical protein
MFSIRVILWTVAMANTGFGQQATIMRQVKNFYAITIEESRKVLLARWSFRSRRVQHPD